MNRFSWGGVLVVITCLGGRMEVQAKEFLPPIEVQVEITEVNHADAHALGVDWARQFSFAESNTAGVVSLGPIERLTPIRADLQMLVEGGAARVLARPNLVTDSGTTAEFRAGGQLPYITSSSLGATHVEFKPFGVALNITPRLLQSRQIRMKLKASLSAPDQANGVFLSGNRVPALFERKVNSTVTVDSGITLSLAGLVQTHKEKTWSGVPILRKIPLLGVFFRWKREQERRTSVIIFVTPKIVEM